MWGQFLPVPALDHDFSISNIFLLKLFQPFDNRHPAGGGRIQPGIPHSAWAGCTVPGLYGLYYQNKFQQPDWFLKTFKTNPRVLIGSHLQFAFVLNLATANQIAQIASTFLENRETDRENLPHRKTDQDWSTSGVVTVMTNSTRIMFLSFQTWALGYWPGSFLARREVSLQPTTSGLRAQMCDSLWRVVPPIIPRQGPSKAQTKNPKQERTMNFAR